MPMGQYLTFPGRIAHDAMFPLQDPKYVAVLDIQAEHGGSFLERPALCLRRTSTLNGKVLYHKTKNVLHFVNANKTGVVTTSSLTGRKGGHVELCR